MALSSYHPDHDLAPLSAKEMDEAEADFTKADGVSGVDAIGPYVWRVCDYCEALYRHRPTTGKPICNSCWRDGGNL